MADPKPTRADAVRSAVDDAFSVAAGQAQTTRDRAQELVDEVANAAGRVREAIEDLRPPTYEEMRALRTELDELRARVAVLEAAKAPAKGVTAPKRRPAKKG